MQNIIFLDIDGPIINTPLYYLDPFCSVKRSVMNQSALGYLAMLVKYTGAKIVTNSSHNYHPTEEIAGEFGGQDLRADLIKHGLKPEMFHDNWRTLYPYNDEPFDLMEPRQYPRSDAIHAWMKDNGPAHWVAFDDDKKSFDPLYHDKNLVHIEFDHGITYGDYAKAHHFLSGGANLPLTLF